MDKQESRKHLCQDINHRQLYHNGHYYANIAVLYTINTSFMPLKVC